MPIVTLLDGSKRTYNYFISVIDIAKDINFSLSQSCVAAWVDNSLVTVDTVIKNDSRIIFIYVENDIALEWIRYSCAQLLSYAIKNAFPDVKVANNGILKNGFYCDIDLEIKLTKNDISIIEHNMLRLVKKKFPIVKKCMSFEQVCNLFISQGNFYKINILNQYFQYKKIIDIYYHEDYFDFCFGMQVPNIKFCSFFKLQNISGAYWLNNKNNKMLQRIYGTAWSNRTQLNMYIDNIKRLQEIDHRVISKKLDLYHIQDEAPGMIFWHNNGLILFRELENFVRFNLIKYNYQEVKTPVIMDQSIWARSGHLNNYQSSIFTTLSENKNYCVKPMNCPGHVQIFNYTLRSYRDLPIRLAEFGSCYRNESSGALHGLMRVRGFTQDDAHIFCTMDQVKEEIKNCIIMIYDLYQIFNFKLISVKLSTRPEKRIGEDKTWDHAENCLVSVLQENNILFEYQSGEGAFYGPKIEFSLHDSLERIWQCGTIQLDFYLPLHLNSFYIDKNNNRQIPVMIHRAILGSIERFIGILIEEYKGVLPVWLAPIQVMVIGVSFRNINYINKVVTSLFTAGIRVKSDLSNDRMNCKIRYHILHYIPYILICGDQEEKNNTVSIKFRTGLEIKNVSINVFIERLKKEIYNRSFNLLEE
ncbi:threonine--tRNA ligase [Buchnera aphidicola (Formosaphis micheliae)]|uniref:threonine--tRNA ligase n=1 Tax=Buchnera aphidicola TaxID=9 RepID=UPI0031B87F3B